MQESIKNILLDSGIFEVPDDLDANLMEYGLDSLGIVLLIGKFEKEFNIKIIDNNFSSENFSTRNKNRS